MQSGIYICLQVIRIFYQLPVLEYLDLSENKLGNELGHIGGRGDFFESYSLKVLNLANCDIVDLSELGRPGLLHRIEEIIIAGNPTAVFGSRSLYFETGAQLLLFFELNSFVSW